MIIRSNPPPRQPTVPARIDTTYRDFTITLTRERYRTVDESRARWPRDYHWTVTVNGHRYAGWQSEFNETEASLQERLLEWMDRQPLHDLRRLPPA